MKIALRVVAILGALVLSGCAVQFSEQEVYAVYDKEADAVDLLLIYRGVTTADDTPDNLKDAKDLAQRFVDKRRDLLVGPWIFQDLDDLEEKLRGDNAESETPDLDAALRKQLLDVVTNTKLAAVGAFFDAEERLSVYQHFRIKNVSALVEFFNHLISARARAGQIDTRNFDTRTRDLWRSHAAGEHSWIRLENSEVIVDLPMTDASFRKVRQELVATINGDDGDAAELLGRHLTYLRSMQLKNERLVLVFASPDPGTFRFRFRNRGRKYKYTTRLADALMADSVAIARDVTIEDVRRRVLDRPKDSRPADVKNRR